MTPSPPLLRPWIILAYLAAYVLCDRLTFFNAMVPVGVTPWNPEPGLSVLMVMFFGLRAAPWPFVGLFLADLVVRGLPAPLSGTIAAEMAQGCAYVLAGLALRRFKVDPALSRERDVFILLAVGVVSAFAGAAGAVHIYAESGQIAAQRFWPALFRFWVGDAVGIAVTAPLVLLAIARSGRPLSWAALRLGPETLAQVAALAFTQWIVYSTTLDTEFSFLYPLFIPLMWIAVRHGFGGAVLGALAMQIGLSVAWLLADQDSDKVTELQFAQLAMTFTACMVGIAVSERRRAAAQVHGNEQRLRSLFALAPVGIAEIDGEGVVASANPALCRLLGTGERALVGQRAVGLLPGLDDLAPHVGHEVALTSGETQRWLEVSLAEVGGGNRIVVFTDIGARKELEARRLAQQAEVAGIARINAAGQLATVMAHQMNQPLASIIYYLRACRRLLDAPDGRKEALDAIEWAVAQAVRASDIIRSLREFLIRGEATVETVDLRRAVAAAADILAPELVRNAVALSIDTGQAPMPVIADRVQVEQLLLNLMRNAVEAMARMAHARILKVRGRIDGDWAVIEVADNGPGIAPAVAADLFKPFVTSKSDGMGLGLAISRSIAESCGGTLDLVTSGDAGAVFAIRLPLAAEA
jgi:two-component system sensor kinase FixL